MQSALDDKFSDYGQLQPRPRVRQEERIVHLFIGRSRKQQNRVPLHSFGCSYVEAPEAEGAP